jgi:hypothetical protein
MCRILDIAVVLMEISSSLFSELLGMYSCSGRQYGLFVLLILKVRCRAYKSPALIHILAI